MTFLFVDLVLATKEEATANHDENLYIFLERARERGLKLNPDKVKLRLDSVSFIGHILTNKGLAPDPISCHQHELVTS